jgi:hypothetical protein
MIDEIAEEIERVLTKGRVQISTQSETLLKKLWDEVSRSIIEEIAEEIAISAKKIARYIDEPVNKNHINCAIQLVEKRFKKKD